jgi:hypothetical protein
MTPLHHQLLHLADKALGVGCADAAVSLTITRKTAATRLAELERDGKVVRAVGGWQGRRIRWFVNPAHAAIFSEGGRKIMAPKEVERRARIRASERPAGVVVTKVPAAPDHRYVVPDGYRGPFSGPIGTYPDEPVSCAARVRRI